MSERCGYAVTDEDGIEGPCDRPATGWRWYQDCGHEDLLGRACDWHANEGGRRLAAVEALASEWERDASAVKITPLSMISSGVKHGMLACSRELRAALAGEDA